MEKDTQAERTGLSPRSGSGALVGLGEMGAGKSGCSGLPEGPTSQGRTLRPERSPWSEPELPPARCPMLPQAAHSVGPEGKRQVGRSLGWGSSTSFVTVHTGCGPGWCSPLGAPYLSSCLTAISGARPPRARRACSPHSAGSWQGETREVQW